ncbi:MAG: acyl-CoA dehydrogenase family protein [Vicinamibacterales bacterium]
MPIRRAHAPVDDEALFRDSVYEFADKEVRPLSREMDDEAKMPRALIDKMFELGIMGVEVPESHGGAGARSSIPSSPSSRCRVWIPRWACSSTCRTRS